MKDKGGHTRGESERGRGRGRKEWERERKGEGERGRGEERAPGSAKASLQASGWILFGACMWKNDSKPEKEKTLNNSSTNNGTTQVWEQFMMPS